MPATAYRRPAFRCPSCAWVCGCLADHRDCQMRRLLYGHHSRVLGLTIPLPDRRAPARSFPGE